MAQESAFETHQLFPAFSLNLTRHELSIFHFSSSEGPSLKDANLKLSTAKAGDGNRHFSLSLYLPYSYDSTAPQSVLAKQALVQHMVRATCFH